MTEVKIKACKGVVIEAIQGVATDLLLRSKVTSPYRIRRLNGTFA